MKKTITEKMKAHEKWYIEAKKATPKTLPKFIKHLTEDYNHDYGTICHAYTAAAIAAASAVDHSPAGGITGFQAGAIMWEFIRNWNHDDNKCGMVLIDYDNMLYPQYEYHFNKIISKDTWEAIQKEARVHLISDPNVPNLKAHPNVIAHWQSIVDGKVPFGYSVSEEE